MRDLFGLSAAVLAAWLCAIGCTEPVSGPDGNAGGAGGVGGDGGAGGVPPSLFPCSKDGVRAAVAEGGGKMKAALEGRKDRIALVFRRVAKNRAAADALAAEFLSHMARMFYTSNNTEH